MEEEKEIKIIENPLQANGIDKLELEMGNDEAEELTRCRKCRILCGRESTVVTVLVLALGGTQFFIFSAYGGGFNREGLWVFLALGILSWLLALSFIVRTCIAIQQNDKKETEEDEKKPSKIAAMRDTMKTRFNHIFNVNGKPIAGDQNAFTNDFLSIWLLIIKFL